MFIADTSIWIDHIRKPVLELALYLDEAKILSHSSAIGELALGQFRDRDTFIEYMGLLPQAKEANTAELLELIRLHKLSGKGLSLVDVQVLASALITECGILTRDKAMFSAMRRLRIPGES
ncbi:MAG: type II toxin-antitoxin system VapC family toxin [Bdellovibrionota bacterium]